MQSIEDLKKQYQGEWLAIEVTEEGEEGPVRGNLVCHSPDHDKLWTEIARDKRRIYVTFAGPLVEKGYAVAFKWS